MGKISGAWSAKRRTIPWRTVLRGSIFATILSIGVSADQPRVDPQAALAEGNRLFRDGQIEAAVEAYLEGWAPGVAHPTLLYNLGAALHELDRLPEAVLWYRRAASESPRSNDPWLSDNLWLARRSLGNQILEPDGASGWISRHASTWRLIAIALGWISLILAIAVPRLPVWSLVAAVTLSATIYGGAVASERWGPRPAVILEHCQATAGELPAGTEAWVRSTADGWRISSSGDIVCPATAVGLVAP